MNLPRALLIFVLAGLVSLVTGCGGPSRANIELRKQNQALRDQIDTLQRRHDGDEATMRVLQSERNTVPSLPEDRIEQLFTVHGLRLDRLTSGLHVDEARPDFGDRGVKVAVVPFDEQGDPLKAAGSFVIEAYDLSVPQQPLVGEWRFDTAESRKHWFGGALLYDYVFECPWSTPPAHPDVTVKVTFTDALTGRRFSAQKGVTVALPPSPATTRATGRP